MHPHTPPEHFFSRHPHLTASQNDASFAALSAKNANNARPRISLATGMPPHLHLPPELWAIALNNFRFFDLSSEELVQTWRMRSVSRLFKAEIETIFMCEDLSNISLHIDCGKYCFFCREFQQALPASHFTPGRSPCRETRIHTTLCFDKLAPDGEHALFRVQQPAPQEHNLLWKALGETLAPEDFRIWEGGKKPFDGFDCGLPRQEQEKHPTMRNENAARKVFSFQFIPPPSGANSKFKVEVGDEETWEECDLPGMSMILKDTEEEEERAARSNGSCCEDRRLSVPWKTLFVEYFGRATASGKVPAGAFLAMQEREVVERARVQTWRRLVGQGEG